MSMPALTERESQIIGLMMYARDQMPDDYWTVEIVQELAGVIARNEASLAPADSSMLIAVGGYVARLGKDEVVAGIEARIALKRAAGGLADDAGAPG